MTRDLTTVHANCSGHPLTCMIAFRSHYPRGGCHLLTCRNPLVIGKLRFKTNSCSEHLCYLASTQSMITVTGPSTVLNTIHTPCVSAEIVTFSDTGYKVTWVQCRNKRLAPPDLHQLLHTLEKQTPKARKSFYNSEPQFERWNRNSPMALL